MEFSRKNYWSGFPFSSPGHLPNPGIQLRSLAFQADSLPSEPPGRPKGFVCVCVCVCVCNIIEYNPVASIAFQLMIDSLTCYGTSFFLSFLYYCWLLIDMFSYRSEILWVEPPLRFKAPSARVQIKAPILVLLNIKKLQIKLTFY